MNKQIKETLMWMAAIACTVAIWIYLAPMAQADYDQDPDAEFTIFAAGVGGDCPDNLSVVPPGTFNWLFVRIDDADNFYSKPPMSRPYLCPFLVDIMASGKEDACYCIRHDADGTGDERPDGGTFADGTPGDTWAIVAD